jgi:hypothetical protein
MTFLQQFMLWGLFAVSIPVIIHLLNRRRFRTVEWGAMQFLLKATRESRGKKRLKHILILLMRSLAIAALVFAVARPLVGGFLGWGGGRVETVILILDRSASMERAEKDIQISKRKSVLKRVAEALGDLGEARLVVIDSATGKAQEVPSPDVLSELSFTAPTDSAADIPGMLVSALDYIQEAKPGRAEIWVASDLQRDDWAPDDSRWDAFRANLDESEFNVKLRILALNGRERNDFAIRVLSARREAGQLVLELELAREEDTGPTTKAVTISHLGARSATQIALNGQSHRFQKRIPLEGSTGAGHGWVSIPDNANQRNNVSYYAYGKEAPVHAYLVAENSTSTETLQSLTRALAPGFANQEVTHRTPSQAHQINYDSASLIVWKAPLPTPPVSNQMFEFVQKGGVILFLPPEEDSEASFGGLSWEPINESARDKFFIVGEWEHNDGAFRDGMDGSPLPMTRLRAIKRRGIEGNYATLASWGFDEEPLLARRIIEQGQILFLTTLPDYGWSNLEQTGLHLVVLQRSFDEGSRRLGAGFFGTAGEETARTQGEEIRSRIDTYDEGDAANAEFEAGVYRFGERTVAVNRPIAEDSLEILTTGQLDTALLDTNYSLLEEKDASTDPFFSEAWRAFLIAMLLFLIVEAILCLQPRRVDSSTVPSPQPTT